MATRSTGREQPGEHWNGRIIREEASRASAGSLCTQMNELADVILGETGADDLPEKAVELAELVNRFTAVAYPA